MRAAFVMVTALTACYAAKFETKQRHWGTAEGGVDLVTLVNTATEESATIITHGGFVEALQLRSRETKRMRDVLMGHHHHGASDEERAAFVRANAYSVNAMLAPFANRIAGGSYTFDGVKYNMPTNEQPRGHAIHGFLFGKTMKVLKSEATDNHASLTLGHTFGEDPGYPFRLAINITYRLSEAGLAITTEVQNMMGDGTSAPFYHGWHPYFKVKDVSTSRVVFDRDCSPFLHVVMPPGSPTVYDGPLIPTYHTEPWSAFNGSDAIGGTSDKPTLYDDAFKAAASVAQCPVIKTEIHDSEGVSVLWQDANYRFIQVFTGSKIFWGDSAIAVEPQSAKTNAFNNHEHLTILSDGEQFSGSYGVYVA